LFFAAAAALAAPTAGAQTAPDMTEPAPAAPTGGWRLFPNERHITVRAEGVVGARLVDHYEQGVLTPFGALLQGSFLFLKAGPLLMGPSLGVQLGFDPVGTQVAIQPGWQALWRLSPRLALTGRLDIPLLITPGACPVDRVAADPGFSGQGFPVNTSTLPVPSAGTCPALAFGGELGVGAALYITSGIALTAEATFDMYFGDSFLFFPIFGGGLGVMIDYEVLP
jgi:hypothetical protein